MARLALLIGVSKYPNLIRRDGTSSDLPASAADIDGLEAELGDRNKGKFECSSS